jgi:hypothetical protein
MHDTTRPEGPPGLLPACIVAALVLASLPLVFVKPVTAFRDPLSITVHAMELSVADSSWDGEGWMLGRIAPPPPRTVAFGVHDIYPLKIYTVRDTGSGDLLVRVESPRRLGFPSGTTSWEGKTVTFGDEGGDLIALVHAGDRQSWPRTLFSIITHTSASS